MKSMQRKFGGLLKRSADEADVGTVLSDFKAMDDALDRLSKDLEVWRNSWDDVLKLQYDTSEAFVLLYKPIEPTNDPEMRHQPTVTPQRFMSKTLGLQKVYDATRQDLQQEINVINTKLIRPIEAARQELKPLKKTVKHRENMKLDYERYQGRVQHAQKKEARSAKEEAALARLEDDLAQAQIDYQTADDQVTQMFPPITAALKTLFPYLIDTQIRIQTTLVGQLYTVLDEYTKKQGMPNPAPGDAEIVNAWEREFTSFRREVEGGLQTIANGKAVNMPMTIPEKDKSTVTGLGLRNKVMQRKNSGQSQTTTRPSIGGRQSTQNTLEPAPPEYEEEEAPPKPPRPNALPSPSIPMGNKPRIPSSSSLSSPRIPSYDQKSPALTPGYPSSLTPGFQGMPNPWSDQTSNGGGTPPSRYATPMSVTSPMQAAGNSSDYFHQRRISNASSLASNAASVAAAAKKKPPPPVPAKRIPSMQAQYVTAIYDFEGQNDGDLAFREGDRIKVVKKTDSTDDWWDGELHGVVGSFPANYVQS